MDQKFGYFIFLGLLIGAVFGLLWSESGNALPGIGIGALVGVFIGWFVAAAVIEKGKEKKER